MFSDRLDFLMRLTNASNSALARAISYDQSYISKIRSGKRALPRNKDFFPLAAAFFVRNLNTEDQRTLLAEAAFGGSPLPESRRRLEALLEGWLRCAEEEREELLYRLLPGSLRLPGRAASASSPDGPGDADPLQENAPEAVCVLPFYGNSGKRAAVERFLSRLCASGRPHTLLLYSDEDMLWLYEDPSFTRRWGALLSEVLSLGGSMKMIHTLSRGAADLMEAVQKWLPLYLTGRIEPFYCPRLRDGLYRRSLFVAQGHSALVSNSVMTDTEEMVNLLVDHPPMVGAFEAEFWNYFALCRPLMRIERGAPGREALLSELGRFEEDTGALYLAWELPGLFTMPPALLSEMAAEQDSIALERFRGRIAASFLQQLDSGRKVAEILRLPDPAALRERRAAPALLSLLELPPLTYDEARLAAHLSAAAALMERYENYRLVLSNRIPRELTALSSEKGAMVISSLPVLFTMEEQNITAALWEYLGRLVSSSSREQDLSTLNACIRSLRGSGDPE